MVSSGLLRRVAFVRTDVSEEPGASLIKVTKIGELGTTQAATSNRRTLGRNILSVIFLTSRQKYINVFIRFEVYFIFMPRRDCHGGCM
jgi:hypothetical protein